MLDSSPLNITTLKPLSRESKIRTSVLSSNSTKDRYELDLSLPCKREWTHQKPIKPVKPVKPIKGADWLTALTALTGYFEVPFSTDDTSHNAKSCSVNHEVHGMIL